MTARIASFFPPLILFEWGAVLVYFHASHRLNGLLHPAFRLPVLGTGFLLILAGACLLFSKEDRCGGAACPDHLHDRTIAESWPGFLILLLPIFLAATISPDQLGAVSVRNRGVVETFKGVPAALGRPTPQVAPAELPAQPGPPDEGGLAVNLPKGWVPPNAPQFSASKNVPDDEYPSDRQVLGILRNAGPKNAPLRALNERRDTSTPFGGLNDILGQADSALKQGIADASSREGSPVPVDVVDLLVAAHEPELQTKLQGRQIEITGQVLDSSGGNFRLMRLLVLCCAADAQPLAVQVQHRGVRRPPQMTWVKVTGKVVFTKKGKTALPVVEAQKIAVIPRPDEPFLY